MVIKFNFSDIKGGGGVNADLSNSKFDVVSRDSGLQIYEEGS